jgi:hypothetical protein
MWLGLTPNRGEPEPAGELQVHGSCNLVRWLFDNELVDEM